MGSQAYMILAKNLVGRVGVKETFRGGGGGWGLKILLQICENLKRSQKISEKMAFFRPKNFFKNAILLVEGV